MPIQAVYRQNPEKFRTAEKARRACRQPHVPSEELGRLRLTENRLEALTYGPGRDEIVCLNCGGIYSGNFSRHPSACPQKPRSEFDSDAYREQWGYNRSNRLTSKDWHARKSQRLKDSSKYQKAKVENQPFALAAFAKERRRQSQARGSGERVRRGAMRIEGIIRRTAAQRGRPRKLRRPEVTDAQIEKILALDVPIADGARRAKLSQTAFYRRIQRRHGWTAREIKARRSLVVKYIFDLRRWLVTQSAPITVQDVIDRHTGNLRSVNPEPFQQFRSFFPHLEAELRVRPQWLEELADLRRVAVKNNRGRLISASAVIALASKIFQRARAKKGRGAPKKIKPEHVAFGEMVSHVLPRFNKGFAVLVDAKKKNPSNSQQWTVSLRVAGFSEQETSAILNSRKALSAAIRWASSNDGKTLKTGKNLYGLFLRENTPPDSR